MTYKWAFHGVSVLAEWFLTSGNAATQIADLPAWSEGNEAHALIHGATYFDRLVTEVEALGCGDHLFFADWRGDADQRLRENGPTVAELFRAAAERGVVVKGLMWRSYPNRLQFNGEQNRHLAEAIERAGGEVLLDQRVCLAARTISGWSSSAIAMNRNSTRIHRRHRSVPLPPRRRVAPG